MLYNCAGYSTRVAVQQPSTLNDTVPVRAVTGGSTAKPRHNLFAFCAARPFWGVAFYDIRTAFIATPLRTAPALAFCCGSGCIVTWKASLRRASTKHSGAVQHVISGAEGGLCDCSEHSRGLSSSCKPGKNPRPPNVACTALSSGKKGAHSDTEAPAVIRTFLHHDRLLL